MPLVLLPHELHLHVAPAGDSSVGDTDGGVVEVGFTSTSCLQYPIHLQNFHLLVIVAS